MVSFVNISLSTLERFKKKSEANLFIYTYIFKYPIRFALPSNDHHKSSYLGSSGKQRIPLFSRNDIYNIGRDISRH